MLEGLTWLVVKDKAIGFLKDHWEVIALAALLIGGGLYLDHRGYERAKAAADARDAERQQITAAVVRQVDGALTAKLTGIASSSSDKIQTIDTEGRTIVQPIIRQELIRDPALANADSCLTPSLLAVINEARGYRDEELTDGGAGAGSAAPPGVPAGGESH